MTAQTPTAPTRRVRDWSGRWWGLGGATDLVAMGNRVVIIPSEKHPLAATDFYQVLETSDMPAGVVNIVTGGRDGLAQVLAEHGNVEAVWHFGSIAQGMAVRQDPGRSRGRPASDH